MATLVAALVFAGCSGKSGQTSTSASSSPPGTPGSPLTTAPPTHTGSSTSTSTTGPHPNHPPSASLVASIQGGALPLKVNFTLNGADADGDRLNYLFDPDGNASAERIGTGAEFPVRTNFTYTATGIYNATLMVGDGKSTTTARLAINVTAGTGHLQVAELTWKESGAACGRPYLTWSFGTPGAGTAWAEIPIDPATMALPYHATFNYTDATSPAGLATVAMDFYGPEASDLSEGGSPVPVAGPRNAAFEYLVPGGFAQTGTHSASGTVPREVDHAVFLDCFTSGGTTVHYTAG